MALLIGEDHCNMEVAPQRLVKFGHAVPQRQGAPGGPARRNFTSLLLDQAFESNTSTGLSIHSPEN